jgi:hypothetical protein
LNGTYTSRDARFLQFLRFERESFGNLIAFSSIRNSEAELNSRKTCAGLRLVDSRVGFSVNTDK